MKYLHLGFFASSMLKPRRYFILIVLCCLLQHLPGIAQTYKFAELTGSPVMNTNGWNLVGDARVGNTGADGNNFNDELILCNPVNSNSGACFFNQPVNVSQCQKWTAEFDYRINDGTGADGIAFCFLANPPTTFTIGGNIGIPNRPIGLMVILDTYLNCAGTTPVPKLEIRYYEGNTLFGTATESSLECPTPAQPTSGTLPILRQPNYNRMKITYDFGQIRVFVNNTQVLTGNYKISFPGYFGFTASTGGQTDRHSIKNFSLYTYKPIVSPPDAGKDITVCSGDSVQLGVPPKANDPYVYEWNPKTNLSNPGIPNPKVKVFNNSALPVTYTYFVTKDSLVNDTLCAYSDDIKITVLGKAAQAGPDFRVCSRQKQQINGLSQPGYIYKWTPATGLSNPNIASPTVQLFNNSTTPQTYQYILTASNPAAGCPASADTLLITVNPDAARTGVALSLCSGESRQLGAAPLPDYRYSWQPATALSNANISNPAFQLENTTNAIITQRYVLTAASTTFACTDYDTLTVAVYPKTEVSGSPSVCPNVIGVVYEIKNPATALSYQWTVSGGTLRSGQGSPKITVDWGNSNAAASVSVTFAGQNCPVLFPVNINRLLMPQKPRTAETRICLATAKGIRFETLPTNGSVYTWFVSGNGTLVSGQGTAAVLVDWQAEGTGKIWVSESSLTQTDACSGTSDTLFVVINPHPDPESVVLKAVSVKTDAEQSTILRFAIQPNPELQNPFTVSRRTFFPVQGNWATTGTVNKTDSLFTDNNLTVNELSYEYKIEGKDRCGLPVTTLLHHSLLLKGESNEQDTVSTVTLTWNEYTGWKNGVKAYEIWRKTDGETDFKLYATVSAARLGFTKSSGNEAFTHHYRIKAIENQGFGSISWSNEVQLEFEHPLSIPNTITPGNDDKNENWVISNLKLYPAHSLTIYNRFGKEIFQTNQYKQDWNGSSLSSGIYYFSLHTQTRNKEYRGWIWVVK